MVTAQEGHRSVSTEEAESCCCRCCCQDDIAIRRYECKVMYAEDDSLLDSGHTVSYVQRPHGGVYSKDHSRQAFTTFVIGVVEAVSKWSVRETQGRPRLASLCVPLRLTAEQIHQFETQCMTGSQRS